MIPKLPGLRYLGAVPQRESSTAIFHQCDAFVFPACSRDSAW